MKIQKAQNRAWWRIGARFSVVAIALAASIATSLPGPDQLHGAREDGSKAQILVVAPASAQEDPTDEAIDSTLASAGVDVYLTPEPEATVTSEQLPGEPDAGEEKTSTPTGDDGELGATVTPEADEPIDPESTAEATQDPEAPVEDAATPEASPVSSAEGAVVSVLSEAAAAIPGQLIDQQFAVSNPSETSVTVQLSVITSLGDWQST